MKKNTNIFERISDYTENKGFKTLSDLATYLGYTNPEKLYRLKRNPEAKPSVDILEDLSNKFEKLNLTWIVTGRGESEYTPDLTMRDRDNIYLSETKAPQLKPPFVSPTVSPTVSPAPNFIVPVIVTVDSQSRNNVVLVNAKARAGYLSGYGDPEYIENLPAFNFPGIQNGTFRAFEVVGMSMYPTIKDKDIVIGEWVESLEHIKDSGIYIFVTKDEGIVIKRAFNKLFENSYILANSDAYAGGSDYLPLKIHQESISEIWRAKAFLSTIFGLHGNITQRINTLELEHQTLKELLHDKGFI